MMQFTHAQMFRMHVFLMEEFKDAMDWERELEECKFSGQSWQRIDEGGHVLWQVDDASTVCVLPMR